MMNMMTPSILRLLWDKPVKPSIKDHEMALEGRGSRGRGNLGGCGGLGQLSPSRMF